MLVSFIQNDNSWKNVPHAIRWYTLILQVTTSATTQIALSAKKRSQTQNTGATEGPNLDMKVMFLWGEMLMTSARICVNDPSNSKLDSYYNRVAKIHLRSCATPWFERRKGCPAFPPLWPSLHQYRSSKRQKLLTWSPYVPLGPILVENCDPCPVWIANGM